MQTAACQIKTIKSQILHMHKVHVRTCNHCWYSSVLQWHHNNEYHALHAVVPPSLPSSGGENPPNSTKGKGIRKKSTNKVQKTKMPLGMHKILTTSGDITVVLFIVHLL